MGTQQDKGKQADKQSYQHQYEPPNLTESEKLHVKNLTDAKVCNAEVERVARNIASAMVNPQTPKKVRKFIRAYLDDLFRLDTTQTPEAELCLYPIVCRKISQIPFVPDKEWIEALTANDRKRAIQATKEETDRRPHKSVSVELVSQLTDALFELDANHDEEKAVALIALIVGVGNEPNPSDRRRLVDTVSHRAYCHAIRYSDAEETFTRKAIKTSRKGRR